MAPIPELTLRLRRRMAALDLNDQTLADNAGVSRGTILAMRFGRTDSPGVRVVARVADALGVTPEWLAWGRGDGPDETVRTALTPQLGA